jgi:undecaprenyl diphosphate synthase
VGLYDRYLALRVRTTDAAVPEHIALVITERDLLEQGAYDTLTAFFDWAFEYGAADVTVYVSVLDREVADTLARELEALDTPRELAVREPDDLERADAPITVGIGLGGRSELTAAIRDLADAAATGDLDPDDVDETAVEDRLVFPDDPDLVIKTGAERLSDFMIWQSVYSELYFTDVNWRDFRERDYLRAIRDYQDRNRRFGE